MRRRFHRAVPVRDVGMGSPGRALAAGWARVGVVAGRRECRRWVVVGWPRTHGVGLCRDRLGLNDARVGGRAGGVVLVTCSSFLCLPLALAWKLCDNKDMETIGAVDEAVAVFSELEAALVDMRSVDRSEVIDPRAVMARTRSGVAGTPDDIPWKD